MVAEFIVAVDPGGTAEKDTELIDLTRAFVKDLKSKGFKVASSKVVRSVTHNLETGEEVAKK